MSQNSHDVKSLIAGAARSGILSATASTLLTGDLGSIVVAGAAGTDLENIAASDVTLVTVLIDRSSSIADRQLAQAVRDGHALLVDAFSGAKERDSILMAVWTFADDQEVLHSYVPVCDATKLTRFNYRPGGCTTLYDTWCAALAANVAYAQQLRDGGTPCRSVVVVVTDGQDVGSRRRAQDCARVSADLLASEQFVLAFVGVGNEDFRTIAGQMGVPDRSVLVCEKATASALRDAFRLVSQSAIRASRGQILPGPQAGFFQP